MQVREVIKLIKKAIVAATKKAQVTKPPSFTEQGLSFLFSFDDFTAFFPPIFYAAYGSPLRGTLIPNFQVICSPCLPAGSTRRKGS